MPFAVTTRQSSLKLNMKKFHRTAHFAVISVILRIFVISFGLEDVCVSDFYGGNPGYTGHYVVICGYDAVTNEFEIRDPASSIKRERVSSWCLEQAHKYFGTDEDLLLALNMKQPYSNDGIDDVCRRWAECLLEKAKAAIDELTELPAWYPTASTPNAAAAAFEPENARRNPEQENHHHHQHSMHQVISDIYVGSSDKRAMAMLRGENEQISSFLPQSLDSDAITYTIKSFFPIVAADEVSSLAMQFHNFSTHDFHEIIGVNVSMVINGGYFGFLTAIFEPPLYRPP
ncbi:transcription factor tcp4 [Phtheirospermum japonicum]|uniref:Transcription factor tcp4 n=1 Tax=Phtheirospermum japonicum TaxID=374723 RepID=A0A830BL85_9LAMI|nr:transcription factor tcp4 [Phtheirospermum japonicum]